MTEVHRDHLVAELAWLGDQIDKLAGKPSPAVPPVCDADSPSSVIQRLFGLSDFEIHVLIAAAGTELDAAFARRVGEAQQNPTNPRMTFSLALAAFDDGHLSALAPSAPLRHYELLSIPEGAPSLVMAPLAIDERILCFLAGIETFDARLADVVLELRQGNDELDPSREHALARIVAARERIDGPLVVPVAGTTAGERTAIGVAAAARLGLRLFRLRAADLPLEVGARNRLRRRWEREALLSHAALWLEVDDSTPEQVRAATLFAEDVAGFIMLSSREPLPLGIDAYVSVHLSETSSDERRARWSRELGQTAASITGTLDQVATQFRLTPAAVTRACISIEDGSAPLGDRLWDACRAQARPRLDELARRIEPIATWSDLILGDENIATLHEIVTHLRHRYEVYQRWGFGALANRGLGTAALFSGSSGTGKTLAAEVVAREARMDLYQIDLSQIVNKYVGETEKNLRRVFDAAEEGGAILLFDEADALFGKRAEVEKGTDRYANVEVSYLLQRMETYRGLSILTTNQRDALDTAFLRRLRYVVSFGFPDVAQRTELWRRMFPPAAPLARLDYGKLARLQLAGGNIRNIAVNAAFVAADAGEPLAMAHLLHAARAEFRKLEKPFPEADVRGWLT